ncbi:DinB family protein [Streptomyces sp. NPDC054784]
MPTVLAAEQPGDERGALLTFLEGQRGNLRRTLHGLTAAQASSTPSASALCLIGLAKHVAEVEQGWVRDASGVPRAVRRDRSNWSGCFELEGEETVESVLAYWDEVAAETEAAVRALPSLDDTFTLPEAPWFPKEPRSWRWMLLHLISEVARHAGHADIVRETLDGKTAFELVRESEAAVLPEGA